MTGREKARAGGMLATIAALNVAGWGIFALAILPRHFHYGGLGVGIGVAVTAWTVGCRHAFDADHIAAIDNSTRKLLADGKRPLATGFFFALGHSSIVLEVLLLAGTAAAATQGLPWYAVLALPLLFAGGMTLLDSVDGLFMNTAYGWAFARPVRKVPVLKYRLPGAGDGSR